MRKIIIYLAAAATLLFSGCAACRPAYRTESKRMAEVAHQYELSENAG